MKRLMGLLVRLYPASWRARYGEEFEALLEDTGASPRHAWDVLASALKMQLAHGSLWRICFAGGLAGVAVAAAVSLAVPAPYYSRAILQATPCDPKQLSCDPRISQLEREAFSRKSLARLLRIHKLMHLGAPDQSLDEFVTAMRKGIRVFPLPSTSGAREFAVEFHSADPILARFMTEEFVANLIDANTRVYHSPIPELKGMTLQLQAAATLPKTPRRPNYFLFAALGALGGILLAITAVKLARLRTPPPSPAA